MFFEMEIKLDYFCVSEVNFKMKKEKKKGKGVLNVNVSQFIQLFESSKTFTALKKRFCVKGQKCSALGV